MNASPKIVARVSEAVAGAVVMVVAALFVVPIPRAMRFSLFIVLLSSIGWLSYGWTAEGQSVIYFRPVGESIRPVTFRDNAIREIEDARKRTTFPRAGASIVPSLLQPLVMDFVVLLGGPRCKDYRFLELESAQAGDTGVPREVWIVNACGEKQSYLIAPRLCNKKLSRTAIAVAPLVQPPRPVFFGASPLRFDGAPFKCPDL
jgi:hypothetical protein